MDDLNKKWDALVLKIEKQFDDEINLKAILYLILAHQLNKELPLSLSHHQIVSLFLKLRHPIFYSSHP